MQTTFVGRYTATRVHSTRTATQYTATHISFYGNTSVRRYTARQYTVHSTSYTVHIQLHTTHTATHLPSYTACTFVHKHARVCRLCTVRSYLHKIRTKVPSKVLSKVVVLSKVQLLSYEVRLCYNVRVRTVRRSSVLPYSKYMYHTCM